MADPDVAREFLANNGEKRPSDALLNSAEKFREKRRRQGLKRQSVKQQVREGFVSGIKAERIEMKLALCDGVCCERCATCFDDFDSAWEGLEANHRIRRSKGLGYRGGRDFGTDDPSNIELLCHVCHDREHPGPMFGEKAS